VYPTEKVVVLKTDLFPSCMRFLFNPGNSEVYVTDIDILILPHKISHFEYFSKYKVYGASYMRGCDWSSEGEWKGENSRICGGFALLGPEYYERTAKARNKYFDVNEIEDYRAFDEIMFCRILKSSGYPIPITPYTFPNGEAWDPSYRDLHLHDFRNRKFEKWKPDKMKLATLFKDLNFISLVKGLSQYWYDLIGDVEDYI